MAILVVFEPVRELYQQFVCGNKGEKSNTKTRNQQEAITVDMTLECTVILKYSLKAIARS